MPLSLIAQPWPDPPGTECRRSWLVQTEFGQGFVTLKGFPASNGNLGAVLSSVPQLFWNIELQTMTFFLSSLKRGLKWKAMSFPFLKSSENLQRQEGICCCPGLCSGLAESSSKWAGGTHSPCEVMRGHLHIRYISLTPGRCSSATEGKFQPPCSCPATPHREPPPSVTDTPTPVPVWVAVDGPGDGYEQPRDESCLQGQLEGDFLADNGDLVLVKSTLGTGDTVTIYVPLLRSRRQPGPGPSHGQAKSVRTQEPL